MAIARPLTEIQRATPEAVLSGLLAEGSASKEAGLKLCREAASFGLSMRDYLTLSIDPRMSDNAAQFDGLNGYEAALSMLKLPVRNDFENGITLQLASQTFQIHEGTRALFPEVVDDMVRSAHRYVLIENTAGMVSNTRTINAPELVSTVIEDNGPEGDFQMATVAEGGRVPISTIRSSENSVKIWKFGKGYQTTYEFNRRASLDLLTPYSARVGRVLETSKVAACTSVILNGDGTNAAAPVKKQSDFGGTQSGKIEYKPLLKWLVSRAKAGVPIDTVLGNWDAYVEWLMLFAQPAVREVAAGEGVDMQTAAERLAATGVNLGTLPVLNINVGFKLSSTMPAGQLAGYIRSETVEELVEANSNIQEAETSIQTQVITYVRTFNAGYKLIFGDTREVYDFTNV